MHIAIDASRATVEQRTGTEGYSYHIIRGLIELGSNHKFTLYFRHQPPNNLLPSDPCLISERVIRRNRFWTHSGLGPAVRADRPDILFVPSHVIPWPGTGQIPSVVTIHDLGYLHYPDKHPLVQRMYLDWSTRHSARVARRIISVSNATAQDIRSLGSIPQDKVQVVYSGVARFLQPASDDQIESLRTRLGISGPYILHVGSLQPRKNLTRLIEAFARIAESTQNVSLVLAGREAWGFRRFSERAIELGIEDRVIFPGYIADADLPALYSGASLYAFPSLYEGFGFPALEAMACGTAVVCSNSSSLPELVGDAALTIAPTDVDDLANAIQRVLDDSALASDLIRRGRERVREFTWEACVRNTLAVLEEAASI